MIKFKKCCRCNSEFPIESFYPQKNTSDGRRSECKGCTKQAAKVYAATQAFRDSKTSIEDERFGKWLKALRISMKIDHMGLATPEMPRCRIREIEMGMGKGITKRECEFFARYYGVDAQTIIRKASE